MTVNLMRERLRRAVIAAQEQWLDREVVWGRDDCAMAAADVLRPVLGYDPCARWRGRYTTPRGYRRVLKRDGFTGLAGAISAVAAEHGWRPVMYHAEPGDVGIYRGMTAALCMGNGFWLARRDFGFAALPESDIHMAWSVL